MPAGRMGAVGAPLKSAVSSGVTFVGSHQAGFNNGDTSDITLTLPLTIATNDFGVIYYYYDTGSNIGNTVTTPTGWTLLTGWPVATITGRSITTHVFYRKLVSGDSNPTIVDTGSGARSAALAVFRGVDTATPFDATTTRSEQENDSTPNLAAITTVTANSAVVVTAAVSHANMTAFVPPSGYQLGPAIYGLYRNVAIGYLLNAGTAGTKSPVNWTATGATAVEESHTVTMALRVA